jgi:hypothetical protein
MVAAARPMAAAALTGEELLRLFLGNFGLLFGTTSPF